MRNRDIELARQWIEKADHDLVTARAVLALPDGPTDTPCFHAQQAVEKALKSLLTAHGVKFKRIHDLVAHFDAAVPRLPELKAYREQIAELAYFAIHIRYPADSADPTRDEAEAAVRLAERVLGMVAQAICAKTNGKKRWTKSKMLHGSCQAASP